jgi:hypothetical protein
MSAPQQSIIYQSMHKCTLKGTGSAQIVNRDTPHFREDLKVTEYACTSI